MFTANIISLQKMHSFFSTNCAQASWPFVELFLLLSIFCLFDVLKVNANVCSNRCNFKVNSRWNKNALKRTDNLNHSKQIQFTKNVKLTPLSIELLKMNYTHFNLHQELCQTHLQFYNFSSNWLTFTLCCVSVYVFKWIATVNKHQLFVIKLTEPAK